MVQTSHQYMTPGGIIALTIRTFGSKVISVFFHMLSRFVIAFLQRSTSFNCMAVVTVLNDFGAQENKVCHCPSICHEVMGLDALILVFFES